jgi:hypothetical protein
MFSLFTCDNDTEEGVFYICSLGENCDCDDCLDPEIEESGLFEELENIVSNIINSVFFSKS